jgi:uncharacterized RDD family membrane protein YckC
MAQNPYAAPSAVVDDVAPVGEFELAGRGDRFLAVIVDGLTAIPAYIPAFFIYGATLRHQTPSVVAIVFMILYVLGLLITNLVLVSRNAQSIGKKLLGIKVQRKGGGRASLGRIFWLRNVVNALPSFIPFVGGLYGLVDALFIFGESRRCVHDYIADTIVIKA